jgi:hypothetical protein
MVADNPKENRAMTKRKRISPSLALATAKALDHMRTGSRLVRMHGRHAGWFVLPGGWVDDKTPLTIIKHPSVIGGGIGLFPQHDQTWRMQTFVHIEHLRQFCNMPTMRSVKLQH